MSHAERTILDFWGREDGRLVTDARHPETVPYYFSAAAAVSGGRPAAHTTPTRYENNLGAMVSRLVAAADRWGLPKVRDVCLDPEDTYIDHKAELPRDLDFPSGAAAFYIQGQDGKELPQLADAQQEAERNTASELRSIEGRGIAVAVQTAIRRRLACRLASSS